MTRVWTRLLVSTALAGVVGVPAAAQVAQNTTGDPVADAKVQADEVLEPTTTTDQRDDDVVVTGTRIIRPNNRSAAPITSTTIAEIRAQGATTIEEVLNRLPQVAPNSEQNYQDSSGRQRIKLRNLGFERTLTLIDGLRMGVGNAAGIDVGIIPTSLVERIDVLSGGASSVYGSDAISGVVNFILKKNFDGIELNGNYSFYNHNNRANSVTATAERFFFPGPTGMTNDGGRADVTLSAGKNLFDNALNITGFVNYRHSDEVTLDSRSISACEVTQPTRDGPLACTRSTYTPAGTIIPQSGANAGQILINDPAGSGRFVGYGSGAGTQANPYSDGSFQRPFNRVNAGGFATLTISPAAELYASGLWYRDKSENPVPARAYSYTVYGSTPYQVNCNNPFLSSSQAQTLCGAQAGSATTVPVDVRYRFEGLPPASNSYDNSGVRIAGGMRGKVFDDVWRYDLAGVYARSRAETIYPAFPDYNRVSNALNVVNVGGTPTCASVVSGSDRACVPFNAFAPGNVNQALYDYIFQSTDGREFSVARLWQGLLSVTGDLGRYGFTSPLADQGIAVAFGVEYRSEKFLSSADEQFRLTNGGSDSRASQSVWEGNVEVQVPLVEKRRWTDLLQVNGGYRQSKYNRLDGAFGTYKVEGLWAPIADITFRGSFNKAQRAPNVTEATQASDVNYVQINSPNDPCATSPDPQNPGRTIGPRASIAACRATGLPDNLYGSTTLSCPDQQCTIRNGGFNLVPETAYTKTFGVILRPRFIKGLTVTVDRFLIDLNDSIGYVSAGDYLNSCLPQPSAFNCRGIVRDQTTFILFSAPGTNPTSGFFTQGTTNNYKSKSHGWDVQAQYSQALGGLGLLDMTFNGSLLTLQGGQDQPDSPERNCAGLYGPLCGEGIPKWTHGLRTTYTAPDKVFSLSVNWRYVGPMTLTYNVTDPSRGLPYTASDYRVTNGRIEPYNYIDLTTSFAIAERFTLRLSVNNVFDKDPPLVVGSRELLGLLRSNTLFRYDLLGRQLVAGVTTRF